MGNAAAPRSQGESTKDKGPPPMDEATKQAMATRGETATFGAGCFWGTQKFFKKQFKDALLQTEVGYEGGKAPSPSYEDVCGGDTGHAEVLQIVFDPTKVSYEELVRFFFRMHNPTTLNRQGNDKGTQYRSVIFYHNDEQKKTAERVIEAVDKENHFGGAKIVTTLEAATNFWRGEEYHQYYLDKNPGGYCNHRVYW